MTDSLTANGLRECEHFHQEPRCFTASNGVKHVRLQCCDCGSQVGSIPKRDLRCSIEALPDWDEQLRLDYWQRQSEARRQAFEEQREARSAEWWARYSAYLESDAWGQRRVAVFERDKWRCQAQYPGCSKQASQIHHLTYQHVGNEPLFDLVAVCAFCHDEITRADRSQREAHP